ncbi:unnamed protein product [Tilletia controversa]|nr:unnamed protein product [Tilletia caries]CAD6955480.1 unnamed protein product [Tilletia caries]CAD6962189.1 unnamed protein product [Tilletia controversa]
MSTTSTIVTASPPNSLLEIPLHPRTAHLNDSLLTVILRDPTSTQMSSHNEKESSAPSGTTPNSGAPLTTRHHEGETDTVPTASATGAPRIFARHTEQSDRHHRGKKLGERASASRRARREQRSSSGYEGNGEESESEFEEEDEDGEDEDEDEEDEDRAAPPEMAPSGSLTLAAFSPSSGMPIPRRAALIATAVAINLGLPFVNGIMLGFGEIVARTFLAPWIGVVLGPLMPARFGHASRFGSSQNRGTGTGGAGLGMAQRERREL